MMNPLLAPFAPSATTQIRMDHAHALGTAQHYASDLPAQAKRALVEIVSIALTIHARLEEELFYPAILALEPALVDRSVPEHDEMRDLIAALHRMEPTAEDYDGTFHALARTVMRHVADEETMLLPAAERVLGDETLSRIGARMVERRIALVAAHAPELAAATLYLLPSSLLLGGAGVMLAGMHALRYAMRRFSA
jgi:hypothetical protein